MVEYKVLSNCIELNTLKDFQEMVVTDCYNRVCKDVFLPSVKEILHEVKSTEKINENTDMEYSIRLKGKSGKRDAKIYRNMNGQLVLKFCYK